MSVLSLPLRDFGRFIFLEVPYVATLGSYGSGDYQFHDPYGVAVDHNGNIYVADEENHRVQIFSSSRVYQATLGVTDVPGDDNAHFDGPRGVAVDSSGNIYVADSGNRRVQVFNSSRAYVRTLGTTGEWGDDFAHFDRPYDVAVDAQGRIYVADIYNQRVQVFDSNGAYLTTIGGAWGSNAGQLGEPAGVDVDSAGNVYIADSRNHRIQKFAPGVPGWRQVNINGFGDRSNSAIQALEVFNGQLYAGATNFDSGASIWRTTDGTTWTAVSSPGFGSIYTNTNAVIFDMIEFNGQLYAGTGNWWDDGVAGQIWRSLNGTTWTQVEGGGFGNANNIGVVNFGVFSNTLYAATYNTTDGLEIWRSSSGNSGDWSRVVANGFNGGSNYAICTGLTVFNGYLYAAVEAATGFGAQVWRTGDGVTWTQVNTDGFGDVDNYQTGGFALFGSDLYVGTRNDVTGAQLWRSNNGIIWTQVISNGFGDSNNYKIESLITFDGALYAATDNNTTGVEVWRSSDGTAWSQINLDGFGDSNNEGTLWSNATVTFNNRIFIGTSNSGNGGEVWLYLHNKVFLPLVIRNYQ